MSRARDDAPSAPPILKPAAERRRLKFLRAKRLTSSATNGASPSLDLKEDETETRKTFSRCEAREGKPTADRVDPIEPTPKNTSV
jgi:hypothetical protein